MNDTPRRSVPVGWRKPSKWLSMALIALSPALSGCGPDDPDPPPEEGWTEAFDATSSGWLLNVWGSSGDDLWAVGGPRDSGVIWRWDGTSWGEVDPGMQVPLVNWTVGFGPDDVTFVGDGGTVLHYDGSSFTPQPTPTNQNLWGVWGASPDDLWAVGGNGRMPGDQVILRYDGSAWTELASPMLEKPGVSAYFKVWGTGPDDVYIVGSRGVVLHWDGSALTEQLVGASDDLISLWGTGPDNIVAVGGRGNGIVSRFNGTDWRTEILAPLPGFNGVHMSDPNVATVVGVRGTIIELDVETLAPTDHSYDTQLDLHAVFRDPSGRLTTVGGSLASIEPPYRGIALWFE